MRRFHRILRWSFMLGVPLTITGILRNNPAGLQDGSGYRGAPLIAAGLVLTLIPVLYALMRAVMALIRLIVTETRKYRAWKATLSPQDRALVDMAEIVATTAALEIAHRKLHAYNKRTSARLADTQVNGFGGNW